jgi:hypothetical protein
MEALLAYASVILDELNGPALSVITLRDMVELPNESQILLI